MKSLLKKSLLFFNNLFSPTKIIDRSAFLKKIDRSNKILEIGPFTNPSLRGENISYFDIMDRDGLIARAKAINYPTIDINTVPEIDFVSPEGDLTLIPDRFSNVYSSHCIEHQPDLITHLVQIAALLNTDGRYYLVIPDKRYCFDALLPESTIASVIEAYHEKRTRHTLSNVIQHYALTTHNMPLRHWFGQHKSSKNFSSQIATAYSQYIASEGTYLDVHAWLFTPKSFGEIIRLLQTMNYIHFVVEDIFNTAFGSNEFYVVLRKTS